MSDQATPRLALPYLAASQAQKHVTLNQALAGLDGLVQCAVESRALAAEPASPQDGQMWILPASAAGADWAGQAAGTVMRYEAGAWTVLPSVVGQLAYVKDEAVLLVNSAGGWQSALSASAAPAPAPPVTPNGFRNRLINGGFGVWQRGSSFTTTLNNGLFAADRWYVYSGGAACTVQPVSAGLPAGAVSGLTATSTSGVGNIFIFQSLESAAIGDLANQSVTFSALVYCSVAAWAGLNLYKLTSPNSIPSRVQLPTLTLANVKAGWTAVSVTFTLPPEAVNGLQIGVNITPTAAAATCGLANTQLEAGAIATPFEVRPPGLELNLCQRYYQLTSNLYGAVGSWNTTSSAVMVGYLSTPMRATPQMSLVGGTVLTVDCYGVGTSTCASPNYALACDSSRVMVTATNLSPARAQFLPAGCNTALALNAEM